MILQVLSDRFGLTQYQVAVHHSATVPGGSLSSTASEASTLRCISRSSYGGRLWLPGTN